MNDIARIQIKDRAREAFTDAFNNQDDPERVWEYLVLYRRVLGENEHI